MLPGRTKSDEPGRLYVNTLKGLFMLEHNFTKFLIKFSSFFLPHTTHTAEILLAALQLFFFRNIVWKTTSMSCFLFCQRFLPNIRNKMERYGMHLCSSMCLHSQKLHVYYKGSITKESALEKLQQ